MFLDFIIDSNNMDLNECKMKFGKKKYGAKKRCQGQLHSMYLTVNDILPYNSSNGKFPKIWMKKRYSQLNEKIAMSQQMFIDLRFIAIRPLSFKIFVFFFANHLRSTSVDYSNNKSNISV